MQPSKFLCAALGLALAGPAVAQDYAGAARTYFEAEVAPQMAHATILEAIRATNAQHAGISEDQIAGLDAAWRAEVGAGTRPTIDPVLGNAVSEHLRGLVAGSEGRIAEAFLMDGAGLNVGASHVTSDYWQGDEAKHQETYGKGAGAVHVSEVEFDESTQSYVVQVSMAIADPADGSVIGAVTVSIDADSLVN
jgi:hypothetical protein